MRRAATFGSPTTQRYLDVKARQIEWLDANRAVVPAPAVAPARERDEALKLQQAERMDGTATTSRPAPSAAQQRYQDLKEPQVEQAERMRSNATHGADLPPRERCQQVKNRQGK